MRLHHQFRALSVVCALGVASGLLRAQTPVQTPVQTPAQTPAPKPVITLEGYPRPGEPQKVTMLSTGAEPRKALRYSIPADFKSHLDMAISVDMAINALGQTMTMPAPTIKMGADVAVTKIDAGNISYTLTFTGGSIEGDTTSPLAMALQTGTAGMSSVKGVTTMTSRGVTVSSDLEVSDAALKTMLAQTGSSVENLSIAFPEEAVGVGARWEVRQVAASEESTQFKSAIYEVTAIDGPSVTLKVTTTITAPAQSISNPMLAAAGGEMKLETLTGSGTGNVVIRLDSLVPTSTTEHATSAAMTVTFQGQPVPATMNGKIKITVTPGKHP